MQFLHGDSSLKKKRLGVSPPSLIKSEVGGCTGIFSVGLTTFKLLVIKHRLHTFFFVYYCLL